MNKNYIWLAVLAAIILLVLAGYFIFMKNDSAKPESENVSQKISGKVAVMETNFGDIKIELFSADAPNTVENFVSLGKVGFYDGVKFHRVIKGFMIQGGDPLSKDDAMRARWGTGGPGYAFADELRPNNHNVAGTIAMANAGPNTNGSQFFINVANNDYLDGKHTVFGKVVEGMDVVSRIENTPTEGSDRPVSDVIIKSVKIVGE